MSEVVIGRTQGNSISFDIPSIPFLGVKSTLKEDSTIETKVYFSKIEECSEIMLSFFREETIFEKVIIKFFQIGAIILSIILNTILNIRIGSAVTALMIVDIIYSNNSFATNCITIIMYFIQKEKRNVKGLHAAEHMTIAAYNQLRRVPTIEEVRSFSKYSSDCGSVRSIKSNFKLFLMCLCGSIVPQDTGNLFLNLVALIVFLVALNAGRCLYNKFEKKDWIKYIGFFSLRKPTDQELNVAIKAIEKLDEIEKDPNKFLREEFPNIHADNVAFEEK